MVLADSSVDAFPSTAPNQFNVKAVGGTRIVSGISPSLTGVTLAPGGGSWASLSDRGAKANLKDVDTQDVLRAVVGLDIS